MSILRDEVHRAIGQLPEEGLAVILAIVRGDSSADAKPPQRWPLPSWVGMIDSGDPESREYPAQ
jgi:hypothetical protein